jgi:hypothetical protein
MKNNELLKKYAGISTRIRRIFAYHYDQKHSKNNYSDNAMKTIAYIMSTYHIGTYDLDIRDILKSYIIARYYGWEPKKEDLEEIISNTSYFNINVDDAIYEVLTMPREEITI